jgi:fido (protein-threonine AMPylation protein)
MGNGCFHLVSESVLNEILRKKSLLEDYPEYHLKTKKREEALRKEANKHSIGLELLCLDGKFFRSRKKKAKEFHRCEKNLKSALDFALKNYSGELTLDYLRNVSRKIDPEINLGGFRTGNGKVRFFYEDIFLIPPSPEKLMRELNYFCLANSCLSNPIEKALHAHFNILRIHPFLDGSGRAARLIQNVILEQVGLPPPSIKLPERREYRLLLEKAIASYRRAESTMNPTQEMIYTTLLKELSSSNFDFRKDSHLCEQVSEFERLKMTHEQNEFYNFIALKIRDSLIDISNQIYGAYNKKKH